MTEVASKPAEAIDGGDPRPPQNGTATRSMTTTYRITTISDVVALATQLSGSWFRGQSRPHDNLTPRVFRQDLNDAWTFRGPQLELLIVEEFQRRAPGLASNLPGVDDSLAWLFLMQHHGAATRLLDWTESALVALYFAVEEGFDVDGELWAMHPDTLNERANVGRGFPLLNNKVLHYLAREPFAADPKRLVTELNLPSMPDRPIALRPTTSVPRMVAQSSMFTLHPSPTHGESIPSVLPEEEYLVRYLISPGVKRPLLNKLWALRVTRRTLFPDLDSLSKTIMYELNTFMAYTPPKPPTFGGPA